MVDSFRTKHSNINNLSFFFKNKSKNQTGTVNSEKSTSPLQFGALLVISMTNTDHTDFNSDKYFHFRVLI